MKKVRTALLSIVIAMSITIAFNSSGASASQEIMNEIQQNTKKITDHVVFTEDRIPPMYHYYSSGGYHGYLVLQWRGGKKDDYYGVYAGTVYPSGSQIPVPFSDLVEEQ